jgi:hypothetical protein
MNQIKIDMALLSVALFIAAFVAYTRNPPETAIYIAMLLLIPAFALGAPFIVDSLLMLADETGESPEEADA